MIKNVLVAVSYVLVAILSGCGGGGSNSDTPSGSSGIGTIRSTDKDYINVNDNFDSLTFIKDKSNAQRILLRIPREDNAVDLWALSIKTDKDLNGSLLVEDIEVKLFENYVIGILNDVDQADVSYLGVSGFINFSSYQEGRFEINFQKETTVGSGQMEGPIVAVEGCWYTTDVPDNSGCSL